MGNHSVVKVWRLGPRTAGGFKGDPPENPRECAIPCRQFWHLSYGHAQRRQESLAIEKPPSLPSPGFSRERKSVRGHPASRVSTLGRRLFRVGLGMVEGEATIAIGQGPAGDTRGCPESGWAYAGESGLVTGKLGGQRGRQGPSQTCWPELELRKKVVTGDALYCQRELSLRVTGRGLLGALKDNQPGVKEAVRNV